MLKVLNHEVAFLKRAIFASGYAMTIDEMDYNREITDKDIARCKKLGSSPCGSAHDNFLSGIVVSMDVKYPEYWSPEFQRYHFAQIVTSQSKMHRILKFNIQEGCNKYTDQESIDKINRYRDAYNNSDDEDVKYYWFMKIVSNFPMGFEKIMQIVTNYLQLKNIWYQRHTHKLKEDWQPFCEWIIHLPLFCELTGILKEEKKSPKICQACGIEEYFLNKIYCHEDGCNVSIDVCDNCYSYKEVGNNKLWKCRTHRKEGK